LPGFLLQPYFCRCVVHDLILIILLMALEYVSAQIFVFRQLGQMVVNIAGIDLHA
jgi:hypothetical protein